VVRAAYAAAEGADTDDAALVERHAPEVVIRMVDDGGTNLKVTRPADVALAEAVLASRAGVRA
jgi:2-C-methyl-D-erythritol 4-phosphate cytidylyltransferase